MDILYQKLKERYDIDDGQSPEALQLMAQVPENGRLSSSQFEVLSKIGSGYFATVCENVPSAQFFLFIFGTD